MNKCAGSLAFPQLMRNEFLITDTHNSTNTSAILFSSAKDIEQYLNTMLHRSNKHCENDKYVFLLQGRLTIILCAPELLCMQSEHVAVCCGVFFFFVFFSQIKTKFLTLSGRGQRSAPMQSRRRFGRHDPRATADG